MSNNFAIPTTPALSPSFQKARRLSRLLSVLFAIGFWVTLLWLVCVPLNLIWPQFGGISLESVGIIPVAALSAGHRAGVMIAILLQVVPSLFILHHAGRAFRCFSKGEIFGGAPIGHIQSAGLWMMISACAAFAAIIVFAGIIKPIHVTGFNCEVLLLIVGIGTTVAAYVMAEARRIADDNLSIV